MFIITTYLHNFQLIFKCLEFSVTLTTAKLCANPVRLLARTPCTTSTFTSALDQFIAGLWCHWQSAPHRKPDLFFFIQCPSPSFWTGCWLLGQFRCSPDPRLVGNPLHVLQQCILCWWNVLHCSALLAEQLSPCLIDRGYITRLIIHDDSETLKKLNMVGIHGQRRVWICCHVVECLCDLRVTIGPG